MAQAPRDDAFFENPLFPIGEREGLGGKGEIPKEDDARFRALPKGRRRIPVTGDSICDFSMAAITEGRPPGSVEPILILLGLALM